MLEQKQEKQRIEENKEESVRSAKAVRQRGAVGQSLRALQGGGARLSAAAIQAVGLCAGNAAALHFFERSAGADSVRPERLPEEPAADGIPVEGNPESVAPESIPEFDDDPDDSSEGEVHTHGEGRPAAAGAGRAAGMGKSSAFARKAGGARCQSCFDAARDGLRSMRDCRRRRNPRTWPCAATA